MAEEYESEEEGYGLYPCALDQKLVGVLFGYEFLAAFGLTIGACSPINTCHLDYRSPVEGVHETTFIIPIPLLFIHVSLALARLAQRIPGLTQPLVLDPLGLIMLFMEISCRGIVQEVDRKVCT
ncbi:hypothetical protein AVEN_171531-1 [Araneus ventricosus]|uniref:Uncharacterized protein n=1 Tax=Araneus ventricosus TaxID=182803 RepID=A0A4Y2MCL7_ARAVE|nr:hypothetical protein AVEN_171531-1 [Araneus ventricosus]